MLNVTTWTTKPLKKSLSKVKSCIVQPYLWEARKESGIKRNRDLYNKSIL